MTRKSEEERSYLRALKAEHYAIERIDRAKTQAGRKAAIAAAWRAADTTNARLREWKAAEDRGTSEDSGEGF